MREKDSYSLSKRGKKNGYYWYVQFKNPDTGLYGTAKSVDALSKKLGINIHIEKKLEATRIIEKLLRLGLTEKQDDIILDEYLKGFWNWDTSPYIRMKLAKDPDCLTKFYCRKQEQNISNYICALPKGLKASQLKRKHIEALEKYILLDRGLSTATLKYVIYAFRSPVKELVKNGYIAEDPFIGYEMPNVRNQKITGVPTREEIQTIVTSIYQGMETGNIDIRDGYMILLAASTGMRLGEIRALKPCDINIPDIGDYAVIHISRSYGMLVGDKGTKSGVERDVTIPKDFAMELLKIAEASPHRGSYVFYSEIRKKDVPRVSRLPEKAFNREIAKVLGLEEFGKLSSAQRQAMTEDDKEAFILEAGERKRKERNIHFHSLRHYANSRITEAIGWQNANLVIGHTSEAMHRLYDHGDIQRALDFGKQIGEVIPSRKEAIK